SSTERELVLKGDNMIFPDAPLAPAAAIALVDTVQQDTMASRIGRRAPNSLRHAIARFRIARRAPAVPRSGLS
ncbi:MAG TPA: hypothetical protein VHM30_09485, partial [Gemmatimonadaceae bacterium]|nr:hypothetical protein [Gemmatimonadaceae bacterium]